MFNTCLKIDLHGYRAREAREYLEWRIRTLPHGIDQVDVVHGYRSGTVLQTIVREEFANERVVGKIVGWNPGETTLIIGKAGRRC